MPIAEQPESILYFYLTTPRVAAPRWFHEGSAVFVDTWMAGGIGRAQGGYDEMVFRVDGQGRRALLRPARPRVRRHEDRLSDRGRTRTSTARGSSPGSATTYSPEQVIQWLGRKPGSRAYYASQFQHVFGMSLEKAWAEWVAFEHTFQQANLDAIRKYPITPYQDLSPRALGSVSRAYYDPASQHDLRRPSTTPGVVAHVGAISTDTGRDDASDGHQGAAHLSGDVARLRSGRADALLHDRQRRATATSSRSTRRRAARACCRRTRASATSSSIARGSHRSGASGISTASARSSAWRRRTPTGSSVVTLPYGTIVYDLDVSPDGTLLVRVVRRDQRQAERPRDLDRGAAARATRRRLRRSTSARACPTTSSSRRTAGSCTAARTTPASRTSSATSSRRRSSRPCRTPRPGFFRPIPLGGDELIVFRYTGQGFVPARITAHADRGRQRRSRSSASRRSRSTRC